MKRQLFPGAVLFLLAIILYKIVGINYPTTMFFSSLEWLLYGSSYLLIGGSVLLTAFKNIKKGHIFDENFLISIATIGAFILHEFPEGIAVMLFYMLGQIFQNNAVNHSWRALIFLVVSCPCALVISIPLSFYAGIGRASKQGILVKGGNYLEGLNNVTQIIFDKTGTLTNGKFTVEKIKSYNNYSNDEPTKLLSVIETAHKTKQIILKNIILSLGVKGLVLIMGALGIATMWEAVFADVGVTLLAVLNTIKINHFENGGYIYGERKENM